MGEEAKTEQGAATTNVFQPQPDVKQVAGDVAAKTVKILDLFKQYSASMSPREKKSFALWIREAYNAIGDKEVNDEELFEKVYKEFMEDSKEKKEEEKKEEPVKASPQVQTTPPPQSTPVPPMTPMPEYPLADDENYYQARKKHFEAIRTIKRRMPQGDDFFANVISQLK